MVEEGFSASRFREIFETISSMETSGQPSLTIDSAERFEFGKNWQSFLLKLTEERIQSAESSLRQMLDLDSLEGKTFLDAGCGSGLFSLAARRLGAKALSFDFDPESVACTLQLKRMFFPSDDEWRIERGSVLDQEYLGSIGSFDVVYSWGVLHHTGAMWEALGNVFSLMKPGGRLFIALYNDQGLKSDLWRFTKRTYNRIPALRPAILYPIGGMILGGLTLKDLCRFQVPRIFSKANNARGMALWTDIVDWVGGYPFEVASRARVVTFCEQRGLVLDRLVGCGRKMGCNQYVFTAR